MLALLGRLLRRLRHRRLDADLREELDFHREMARSAFEKMGVHPTEAQRASHLKMGNETLARENARGIWIPARLDAISLDVKYGFRTLMRHKGLTLVAIGTLTVAIGLNTSLLAVFSATFLRPWSVADPSHVFTVTSSIVRPSDGAEILGAGLSFEEFTSLRDEATRSSLVAFSDVAFPDSAQSGPGRTVLIQAEVVSADFFDILRVPLEAGSGLTNQPGAVVVISDGVWTYRFGRDPRVLGRTIDLDVPRTIVGVVSPAFPGIPPQPIDLYVPFPGKADWASSWQRWWGPNADTNPATLDVSVAGRLHPGWSRRDAQAELSLLRAGLAHGRGFARAHLTLSGTAIGQQPGGVRSDVPLIFALLFAATGAVLVLGCANVGNLQLARAVARRQEIAARLALGASRSRVVCQLLIESAQLAGAAGIGATVMAWWLPKWILSFDPGSRSLVPVTPDVYVHAASVGLVLASTVGFGLAPALTATRGGPTVRLFDSRMPMTSVGRLRGVLLGAQVAIAAALLVSATLLSRGLLQVVTHTLGFEYAGVLNGSLQWPSSVTDTMYAGSLQDSIDRAFDGARATEIAYADGSPLGSISRIEVRRFSGSASPGWALAQRASPAYFDVLRIPFVTGRPFSADPVRQEAVVNRAFLDQWFPEGLTSTSRIVTSQGSFAIVGVVGELRLQSLDSDRPTVILPLDGRTMPRDVLIRSKQADAAERLMAAVNRVDPRLSAHPYPLARNVTAKARNSIIGVSTASGIGLMALALSAVGVFGTFRFFVEERQREIGIRLALGASVRGIVETMVRSTRAPLVGGLVAGGLLAVTGGTLLRGFLYGLSPFDPVSYSVVCAILGATAVLATYIPVKRALSVDPAITLRYE